MKRFKDIYIETDDSVKLTLGYDKKNGKLVIGTSYVDDSDPRRPVSGNVGTFVFDSEEAFLKIGEPHIGKSGKIELGHRTVILDGGKATITAGGNPGGDGTILVKNKLGNDVISLDGSKATVTIGEERTDGMLKLRNRSAVQTIVLNGEHGNLVLGGGGADGDIKLKNHADQETIILDANNANVYLGGGGTDGDIRLKNRDDQETILLDADGANAFLGGGGVNGDVTLKNAAGEPTISLIGQHGNMVLGTNGADGDITIKSSAGENAIVMNGDGGSITAGGVGTNGDIIVKNNNDIETVKITGSNGDIQFLNADFAEEFEVEATAYHSASPGMVMILNEQATLEPCRGAYDPKVVGVIAGAGSYKPALVLDKQTGKNRMPVAMIGKVFCQVTAEQEPILVGDLLTTSHKPGHAMKASDRQQALGTVIGKALGNLGDGDGLIPVLVNLQ